MSALENLISQLETDTALIETCLQTSTDDPNWENVCVAPPGEAVDRSDKDTALDIIWAASMYQAAGETCSPQVSFSTYNYCIYVVLGNYLFHLSRHKSLKKK